LAVGVADNQRGTGSSADPVLRVLAHPVRLRMLSLMWASSLSATGLAAELGIGHGLASQHLRKLADAGLVEQVEVRTRRGGRERLYRTVRGRHLSDRTGDSPLLAEALAANLRYRAAERLPGKGVTVDADLWVPAAVWHRFLGELAALADWLHAQAEPATADGVVRAAVTVMAFQLRHRGQAAAADADR
jgi:DNA-binding transcriptional ArsR family regulator